MKNYWNLKLNRALLFFIFGFTQCFAQLETPSNSHYLFPIIPGKQNLLAGTMGELRSTHFHAGLDIRTSSITGLPVRAANSGYVARIIVSSYGYGKAIILKHPDGNQTLYAHLDQFKGLIGDYVLKKHYAQKSFDLDITLNKNELTITQGDTIALSGNTGGSQGPHLHFEIRDSANHAINPLKFNFAEIIDTYPPQATKIALNTMDSSARINDKFGRFEFTLLKQGDNYTFSQPILAHGKIGVEILAIDKMNNSGFRFGINYMEMIANSKTVFKQSIDTIDFEETRGIQNIFNYKVLKQKGQYFNKLYVDDGNRFSYHNGSVNNGIIQVNNQDIPVEIKLKDTYGNESTTSFTLKSTPVTNQLILAETISKPIEFEIFKNVMKVTTKACTSNKLQVLSSGIVAEQTPSYGNTLVKVYLVDLKKVIPDTLKNCGNKLVTNLKALIPSAQDFDYASSYLDVKFNNLSLYDTLYLNESYSATEKVEVFTIGSTITPLFKAVEVTLKPRHTYAEDKTTSVYSANGGNLGGKWNNGTISFFARDLGNYTLLQDITPPTITKIFLTPRTARFKIGDNRSGIASFEASLNGEWLLMDYEYKTGILLAERLDKTKLLKGNFELRVTDNAGNVKTFKQNIL